MTEVQTSGMCCGAQTKQYRVTNPTLPDILPKELKIDGRQDPKVLIRHSVPDSDTQVSNQLVDNILMENLIKQHSLKIQRQLTE